MAVKTGLAKRRRRDGLKRGVESASRVRRGTAGGGRRRRGGGRDVGGRGTRRDRRRGRGRDRSDRGRRGGNGCTHGGGRPRGLSEATRVEFFLGEPLVRKFIRFQIRGIKVRFKMGISDDGVPFRRFISIVIAVDGLEPIIKDDVELG